MKLKFYLLISLVGISVIYAHSQSTKYESVVIKDESGTVLPAVYELKDKSNSKEQIFYSTGKMYVAPRAATNETSMYVQGSMLFTDDSKVRQQGITDLTGDFVLINTKSTTTSPTFLFDIPSAAVTFNPEGYKSASNYYNTGIVRFVGKYNRQDIYALYGNGTSASLTPSSVNNQLGFIANFPKVLVRKDTYSFNGSGQLVFPTLVASDFDTSISKYNPKEVGFVNIYDNVGASINQLDITGGNRFRANVNSEGSINNWSDVVKNYKLNYSYLDINEMVNRPSPTDNGSVAELSMRLYDYTPGNDIPQNDTRVLQSNTTRQAVVTTGLNTPTETNVPTFLRSFTSPIQGLYTDFMYFHVLTSPNKMGSLIPYQFLFSTKDEFQQGKSYYFAMDLTNKYFSNVEEWSQLPTNLGRTKRARGGYLFSRLLRTYDVEGYTMSGSSLFANLLRRTANPANSSSSQVPYVEQRFIADNVQVDFRDITSSQDSQIPINDAGTFIYLANPYLTPITLTPFLQATGNQNSDVAFEPNYNGKGVPGVKAVSRLTTTALTNAKNSGDLLVRARYWVMNSGVVLAGTGSLFYYSSKYDLVDRNAAAPTITDIDSRVIQPMQTFALQAATPGIFTFIPQMKVRTGKPFDIVFESNPYNRSLVEDTTEDTDADRISDWFFIQALSMEGGDLSADRTAVRFFSDGKNELDSNHDVVKNLGAVNSDITKTTIPITENGLLALKSGEREIMPTNALYTKKNGNIPLLASSGKAGLTKELPLYYIPSKSEETVELSFHGLSGFQDIKSVHLIDRHELDSDNKPMKIKLDEGSTYTFKSYSENEALNTANRFILLFDEDSEDNTNPSLTDSSISSYYSGSTLYVQGLNEKDKNSIIYIYDMQGRLMGTTKVNNYPTMEYYKPLGLGTFVVRIVGSRSYDNKFVNTQNY